MITCVTLSFLLFSALEVFFTVWHSNKHSFIIIIIMWCWQSSCIIRSLQWSSWWIWILWYKFVKTTLKQHYTFLLYRAFRHKAVRSLDCLHWQFWLMRSSVLATSGWITSPPVRHWLECVTNRTWLTFHVSRLSNTMICFCWMLINRNCVAA